MRPEPVNEPILEYRPGSPERAELRERLAAFESDRLEIASVVGGEPVLTGNTFEAVMPHRHGHVLADVHTLEAAQVELAIDAAREAWHDWSRTPFEERAAVLLHAADLLAGEWRQRVNAATMLNQSKTVHQAEIDSAAELIDFFRFNVSFAERILAEQPISPPGAVNRLDYRALEGFVFAVTPFNFTSIAGNLPTSAALMGNTVLWKPASSAALAPHVILQLLTEAGLPPGVINLVYGSGPTVGDTALANPELAGVHFTGSTPVFQGMWRTVGDRLGAYRNYPRLVGETGGKNFLLVHASADLEAVATAVVRGGYEYQGQKCSAVARLFVPASLWPALRDRLIAEIETIPVGDVTDLENFMGAVIDQRAFDKHSAALDEAAASAEMDILAGGTADNSEGWFVQPTLIETRDPSVRLMKEELFGPIVTAYVYDEARWAETIALIDDGVPYGLTGAVFATDEQAIAEAAERLRYAAGNFYVNDKPTGAVVGQQPFGGARASGTNDKAGSMWNLIRWVSPRVIKQTAHPPTDYRYPFMAPEA